MGVWEQNRYRFATRNADTKFAPQIWWRWRELNPRPQDRSRPIYMLISPLIVGNRYPASMGIRSLSSIKF